MNYRHPLVGQTILPDDVNPDELAAIDADLTQRAMRQASVRADLEPFARMATDLTRPSMEPRPVSTAAAAAMSPQQLAQMQAKRQEASQFQQGLAAQRERDAARMARERNYMQGRTQLERMRMAAGQKRFEQEQEAAERRFKREQEAENERWKREQEAKQAAEAAGLVRGTPWSYKGGVYNNVWDEERQEWRTTTIKEPPPPQVDVRQPEYGFVLQPDGLHEVYTEFTPGVTRRVAAKGKEPSPIEEHEAALKELDAAEKKVLTLQKDQAAILTSDIPQQIKAAQAEVIGDLLGNAVAVLKAARAKAYPEVYSPRWDVSPQPRVNARFKYDNGNFEQVGAAPND